MIGLVSKGQKLFYLLIILGVLLAHALKVSAQSYKSIVKAIDKQEYIKARTKIENLLAKNRNDVGALYLFAIYHFDSLNLPFYNLDSAYHYLLIASDRYYGLDIKEVKKLDRASINSQEISGLKSLLERKAFEGVSQENTEKAYDQYVKFYSTAVQSEIARNLRDDIAYKKAEEVHSWQSYQVFFEKYPKAAQAGEAKKRYDRLLFLSQTEARSIEAYEKFIVEHPQSPFRSQVEEMLFRAVVADHKPSSYQEFIRRYPQNSFVMNAWKALFFMQEKPMDLSDRLSSFDSLQKLIEIPIYAFLKEGKFGFMDQKTEEVLPARYEMLSDEFRCGDLEESYFLIEEDSLKGVVLRNGEKVGESMYNTIEPFVDGILKVKRGGKYGLLHLSGYLMIPCEYPDIDFVNNSVVLGEDGNKEYLLSFYNDTLVSIKNGTISVTKHGHVLVEKEKKYAIEHLENLFMQPQQPLPDSAFRYDQVEVEGSYLKLKHQDYFEVWDSLGRQVLPHGWEIVERGEHGWVASNKDRYFIFTKDGKPLTPLSYQSVILGRTGYGVKNLDRWGVLDFEGNLLIQPIYDTLFFLGEQAILLKRDDKRFGYFFKEELMDFTSYKNIAIETFSTRLEEGTKEKSHIIVENKRGFKGVISIESQKERVPVRFQDISILANGWIVVELYQKRGLYSPEGKSILSARYDGIATYDEGYFSLLRNQQFGLYDAKRDGMIPTSYEALLKKYGDVDSLFIAKKNGAFGLIDSKNNIACSFLFDELHYWNDSTVLVKKDNKWRLYDFIHQRFQPDVIFDAFDYVWKNKDETVVKTFRSSGMGLISNRKGRLLAEEYTNITSLGDDQNPLFFTENTITNSSLYIIQYIDGFGKVLKEQVLEEEDYQKIACDP